MEMEVVWGCLISMISEGETGDGKNPLSFAHHEKCHGVVARNLSRDVASSR